MSGLDKEAEKRPSRRKSSAYGIEIDPKRDRTKRRKGGGRQSNWESALRSVGLGFVAFLITKVGAGIAALFHSPFFLSLPVAVLLLITSTDFLVLTSLNDSVNQIFFNELGVIVEDSRRPEVELLKTQVLKFVYLYIFVFCLFHWRVLHGYFKSWPHWGFLLAVLMIGTISSVEPIKVATNTTLILIGLCAALLFCRANADSWHHDALYKVMFVPMLALHLASLGIFFLYDTSMLEFLSSSNRFGGLAGNPNTLGGTIVLGYWAAISLILSSTVSLRFRLSAIASIPLFLLHLVMTGSGTAVVAVLLVSLVVFWLRILAFFNPTTRLVINGSALVVLTMLALVTLISSTPADIYLGITSSLGKDQSLTGRTELWDIARNAISERPYFGWGFDSHASVKSVSAYYISHNHYHNGFLDTLVAGGFLLLAVVLYNLGRFIRAFFLAFRNDSAVFPLILPLIILLFLNFSEYSLLRPNSPIWQIYVVAFVMLTYNKKDKLLSKLSKGKKPNTKARSRKRQLRWA